MRRVGYLCIRLARKLTGWNLGTHTLICYYRKRPASHIFDEKYKKFIPTAQDTIVLAGIGVTIIGCVVVERNRWLGIALLLAHLWGVLMYHMNVIVFDEFSVQGDPRPWSYRRIFAQALINFLETCFIFAGLYQAARTCLSFKQALFWSIQGLTLNVPYEWQFEKWNFESFEVVVFEVQVLITLVFVVVVLSLITSAMFKRPDIESTDLPARNS